MQEIRKKIQELEEILASERKLKNVIIQELREVQKSFGDKRRTEIVQEQAEISLEDLIPVEDVAVTVSHQGYLKRTPVITYRQQGRGGKGRIGMRTREEDFVEHLLVASTHTYILIFTSRGKVHWLKVYEIPDAGTAGRGKNIVNLINLDPGESVRAFLPVKEFAEDRYVVMVTRDGVIKKSRLSQFDNPMSRGIIAVSLDDGDELIRVGETSGDRFIFLGTHDGKAIRFPETDVRPMGRQARGVRAMTLGKSDYLIGMEVVGEEGWILTVTENGYGKRTELGAYRIQSARRQGHHQPQNHPKQRQGRRHHPRHRPERSHHHHAAGQDHSSRIKRHPLRRSQHPGRAPAPHGEGRGRPHRRRLPHLRVGRERQRRRGKTAARAVAPAVPLAHRRLATAFLTGHLRYEDQIFSRHGHVVHRASSRRSGRNRGP